MMKGQFVPFSSIQEGQMIVAPFDEHVKVIKLLPRRRLVIPFIAQYQSVVFNERLPADCLVRLVK